MNKIIIYFVTMIFITFPLQAVEKESVVLREWDNNKNVEYLEYVKSNSMGNLRSYMIKSVYGDLQDKENKGGYNISIRKYIMSCSDKVFLLQKTYLFNGEELIKYTKFDQTYYQNDPAFGWKELDTDKIQNKISEIFCK